MTDVLVISGTGWVGHQVVRVLSAAGHDVAVTSRGGARRYPLSDQVPIFQMQRGDADALDQIMTQWRPRIVIDLIPLPSDIEATIALCQRHTIDHYLHCSSTSVYPPLEYLPADEDHPWERDTPGYGAAKVEVDGAVLRAFDEHGFPATVLRPSNIHGEGQLPLDGLGGRYAEYWRRVFNDQPVSVPGRGQMLLQPVHCRDLAESFLAAIEHRDAALGQTYIITGDKATTLHRYIATAVQVVGSSSPIERLPIETYTCDYVAGYGPADGGLQFLLEHMCFTADKARQDLHWTPRVGLEEGLRRTMQWAKQQLA